MRLLYTLLVGLLVSPVVAAQAVTHVWVGGSGSWQDPTKWSPQSVPGPGATVRFSTSATITLDADVEIAGVAYQNLNTPGITVTINSSQYKFNYIGVINLRDTALTVNARVDSCGSISVIQFGASTRLTLNNVGRIVGGSVVNQGVDGLLTLKGETMVLGSVSAAGGGVIIEGGVREIGDVTVSSSGTFPLVSVNSDYVGGDIEVGCVRLQNSGRLHLYGEGFYRIECMDNSGPIVGGGAEIERAEVLRYGTSPVRNMFRVEIEDSLHVASAAYAAGTIELSQSDAVLVLGEAAPDAPPALFDLTGTTTVQGGGLIRAEGPVELTRASTLQLSGATFTLAPDARLRVVSGPLRIAGAAAVNLDGALSVAAAASVTVAGSPTQLSGLLDIELGPTDANAGARVALAGLTASGSLTLSYPVGDPGSFPNGTVFTPLSYTSLSGTLAPVTLPSIGGDHEWAFAFEPTAARLIVAPSDAPIPQNDAVETDEDVAFTFDPSANDAAPHGGDLTTVAAGPATLGSVVLTGDGDVTYTPHLNVFGQETFPYTVRGANGVERVGSITVVIEPVNDPPLAVADTAATQEAVVILIDALANDTDVEADPLTLVWVEPPPVGNAFAVEGRILFSPPVGFLGQTSFRYAGSDGALRDTALVTVTVSPFSATEPLPTEVSVSAPYPNPSSGPVAVRVALPAAAEVGVAVYDVLGRQLRATAPVSLGAGRHAVVLSEGLPPGAYFYRVRIEGEAGVPGESGRFTVVR